MKLYFDDIDYTSKGYITIDGKSGFHLIFYLDYVDACHLNSSLRLISISLFKYFDKKGCGSITFLDMIKAMIPGVKK